MTPATVETPAPPVTPSEEGGGLRIWTDGCCLVNPGGPGGWAIVVEDDGEVEEVLSGGQADTTNNTMEMRGVLEALKLVRPDTGIEIISDSKYVVEGLNSWILKWKRNGWRRGPKPVLNQQLWERLDANFNREAVTLSWVKAHSGLRFNEIADKLASNAARSFAL